MDFKQERSFATSDQNNLSLTKVANSNELFILEQRSSTESRLLTWNPSNDSFENANNNVAFSADNGRMSIDATYVEDTLRMYTYNSVAQIFKSSDMGDSWDTLYQILDDEGDPINIWQSGLYISPSDPYNLLIGSVNCYRSSNGGRNWQLINDWSEYYQNINTKLHADIMSFKEHVDTDGEPFILINNHGGISVTRNGGQDNTNIGLYGLNNAQYYDVRSLPSDPKWVFAGSQDQGIQKGILLDDEQIGGFSQIISGDYGHIEFSNNNTNMWTVYPFGTAYFYDFPTTNWFDAFYSIPVRNNPVWIPPLMPDPDASQDIMYMAGGSAEEGGGGSYMVKMTYENGSITAENMPYNFINYGTISAMMTSPLNPDLWYVATTDGSFFTSEDRGMTFEKGNVFGPGNHWLYGSGILPSAEDENVVYFCGSGYSGPGVFKSEDKGATWEIMDEGLPPTMVFNVVANENESLIYASTEAGPYVYIVAEEQWYDLSGASTPTQTFWSVEYLEELQTARFGTYGRGIWDFKIEPQFVNTNDIDVNTSDISVYPNPASDIVNLKIEANTNELFTARVIDINGKVISQKLVDIVSGESQLDVSHLNAGNYVIQLINSKKQYAQTRRYQTCRKKLQRMGNYRAYRSK